jgi:hypothetical protein
MDYYGVTIDPLVPADNPNPKVFRLILLRWITRSICKRAPSICSKGITAYNWGEWIKSVELFIKV